MIKKLTAKTVDEDPAGCKRWISRKKDLISQNIQKTRGPKTTTKLIITTCFVFSITLFRLPIPAFFRFADVTEFMIGITIFSILLVFTVTLFKIDQNKNQNRSIDKVQNLGNERR